MAGLIKLTDIDRGNVLSSNHYNDRPSITERDRVALMRLGKKPVLKRNFGFLSIYGFACTILVCWESTLIVLDIGLRNGGPAGLVYGYIFVWVGSLTVFTSLSELASMAPTAGGQYHWVSMLAPPSSQKFFSYLAGWLTVCGWQGTLASAAFLSATLVQGIAVLTNSTYSAQPYQATLLVWAIVAFAVFINAIGSTHLPKFEGFILILHILGFFAVLIPLTILGYHQEASTVFDVWLNGGNWPTQSLSFMIGLTGSIFVFVGADGAIHMSEEIQNASTIVPRAIVFTYISNGLLGFGILLAALLRISDLKAVQDPPSGFAFIEIFLQATHSIAGTTVMVCIITVMQICATVSILASTSRQFWSFARDHGIPGWRTLQKVDPKSTVPIWSILATTMVACLLSLINLGSSTALNDILSLAVAGLYSSYLLALTLLLWRRCTGTITHFSDSDHSLTNTVGARLTWGPWHLPGAFGITINVVACVYLSTALFVSFWPPDRPVTPQNMNYSSVMLGGVVILSVLHYLVWGKKQYTGPLIEVAQSHAE